MRVTLSAQEMYLSGLVGFRRNLEAICRGRKPRFPEKYPGELFAYHIHGAMAEFAVAKATNKCWSGHINKFSAGDVGDWEVRYSQRQDMKVRERDDGIVIAVTGLPPDFTVVGYEHSDNVKMNYQPESPREGPAAYFVPHGRLLPIDDLL